MTEDTKKTIQTIKREVELPKEVDELADGFADIAVKIIEVTEDGFQVAEDSSVIIMESVGKLPKMIDGVDKIDDEGEEMPYSFALAWAISGKKVYKALRARKAKKQQV